MKLFNMNIDDTDLKELKIIAIKKGTSAAEIIRKFVKDLIKKESK